MFLDHFNDFNEAISNYAGSDRDSVLYHEDNMYRFANDYLAFLDVMTSHEVDVALRYMRYHIDAIKAYTGLKLDTNCIMFEMLDTLSASHKELEAC